MTSSPSELNIFSTESARISLVTTYRKSGLSLTVFCEQHGVKASTFKNWFYRYPERSQSDVLEVETPQRERTLDPSFLFKAITVQEDSVESPETPRPSPLTLKPTSVVTESVCLAQTLSPQNIYIECSQFRISVPIGFDVTTLQSILSVMQALS